MIRSFLILAVLLSVGFGLAAVGPGAAQESTNSSDAIQLDDHTRIVDYHFGNGSVTMEIEADRPGSVTIADAMAGIGEEGATKVPETTERITPGSNSVTTSVTSFRGAYTVGVTSGSGTVRLSTEMDESSGDNPLRYFGGESGLFTGMAASVILSLGAAGWVVWRENSGVIEA